MEGDNNNKSYPIRRVGYVFSPELLYWANQLPEVKGRALLVHQLIAAYKLLKQCHRIDVTPATAQQLRHFHSEEYIECLRRISNKTEVENEQDELQLERFGLVYDCPPFVGIFQTVAYLAASSMAAAQAIANKQCHIALNWFGGWHHGSKDEAAGFCYTNDIVFGILTLLENSFRKVLYIDLDLHHGNGVEDAFAHTNKVVTWSIHKHELGFFPNTGSIDQIGEDGRGKYHCVNIPLQDGVRDHQYSHLFERILCRLMDRYRPEVIVCQCGADGLAGDRMGCFNLTLQAYEQCVRAMLACQIPLILLGGGGYHLTNTARLWTSLTALCLNQTIDQSIPEHDYFLHYGPSFELEVTPSTRPNQNNEQSLGDTLRTILANIDCISD